MSRKLTRAELIGHVDALIRECASEHPIPAALLMTVAAGLRTGHELGMLNALEPWIRQQRQMVLRELDRSN